MFKESPNLQCYFGVFIKDYVFIVMSHEREIDSHATANPVSGRTTGARKPKTMSSWGIPASSNSSAMIRSVPS